MLSGSVENGKFAWQEAVMPDKSGAIIRFGDMLVSEEGHIPSPHAIYVEQPPNSSIPTHYHDNAQYQIVVRGGGKLGMHPVKPITVHYAAGQTVYGPIVSGEEGLVYLTLRAVTEFGAHWWPASRAEKRRATRKWQMTEHADKATAAVIGSLAAMEIDTVLAPEPNGLAAWVVRVPPGEAAALPSHEGSAGQFLIVTSGSMAMTGESHEGLSVVWVDAEEQGATVRAGPGGLEVVVAQFPREALQ